MNTTELPATLHDLYNSQGWDYFISDKLGNDLFINDPERAERIHEAAEDGCDGSTHQEHIDDWREYVDILRDEAIRASYRTETEEEGDAMEKAVEAWHDAITAEIDACEAWHEANGSLEQQGA